MKRRKWTAAALEALTAVMEGFDYDSLLQAAQEGVTEIKIKQDIWFLPFDNRPVIFTSNVTIVEENKTIPKDENDNHPSIRVTVDVVVTDLTFQGSFAASQASGGLGDALYADGTECFE